MSACGPIATDIALQSNVRFRAKRHCSSGSFDDDRAMGFNKRKEDFYAEHSGKMWVSE